MGELQVWADGTAGTAIGAAVWNERTVLACDWSGGRVLAFGVEHGELSPWGDGYSQPEGIVVLPGDAALITERTGALLRQDLLNPGRAGAVELATGLGAPHQVVVTDDRTALWSPTSRVAGCCGSRWTPAPSRSSPTASASRSVSRSARPARPT